MVGGSSNTINLRDMMDHVIGRSRLTTGMTAFVCPPAIILWLKNGGRQAVRVLTHRLPGFLNKTEFKDSIPGF